MVVCQSDPGPLTAQQVANGDIPAGAGCQLLSGIEFSITQDGQPLNNPGNPGGPFTSTNGVFHVTLNIGSVVVITENVDSIPSFASSAGVRAMVLLASGFTARVNPIVIGSVSADQQGVVFVNVLQAGPSPSPSPSPSASPSPSPSASPSPSPSTKPKPSPTATPGTKELPNTGFGPTISSPQAFTWWVLGALLFMLALASLILARPDRFLRRATVKSDRPQDD